MDMVDIIKEALYICLDNKSCSMKLDGLVQDTQGVMTATVWAKPVRVLYEVLLIAACTSLSSRTGMPSGRILSLPAFGM